MAMSLASVESTKGRPGIGNLRYAAEERGCFTALKVASWVLDQVGILPWYGGQWEGDAAVTVSS